MIIYLGDGKKDLILTGQCLSMPGLILGTDFLQYLNTRTTAYFPVLNDNFERNIVIYILNHKQKVKHKQ